MPKTELAPIDEPLLKQLAKRVDEGKKVYNGGIKIIGEALAEAQKHLATAGQDGKFSGWVKRECGFSRQTAYNYIGAWEVFLIVQPNCTIQDVAMYALTKCPIAAKKAIVLDKQGKTVDKKKALELRKESGEEPKPKRKKRKANPAAEATAYVCPNCGGTEQDEDGDCAKCKEPGGYEPSEAAKPLAKLATTIGKAAREWGEVKKILGISPGLQAVFDGLDKASIALAKFRKSFKKAG